MNFSDKLNNYIDIIGCTAKELSNASGISTSVISRYRNNERTPKYNSTQLKDLIKGLSILAEQNNINNITEQTITKELNSIFFKNNIDFELFRNNFNTLISTLNINISELSKYIGFDSSYISKIRKGTRKPQNPNDFVNAITKYITTYYNDQNYKEIILSLIGCSISDLDNKETYKELLNKWLCNNIITKDNTINEFLLKLDEFDLNNYIKIINFDKIKVPTMPIQLPKAKTYYGIEGYKTSQIDILKAITLSKSTDDVFFYSNMPMTEASKDIEFTKKIMIGLAFILKKGLHLNIIHNLDRPWNELMLGLIGWIPLYMTGQINPFYLKNNSNLIYSQLECVSGTNALSGTSLTNNMNTSKYYLTNKKEEVEYYKKISKYLLKQSKPLIKIYKKEKEKDYYQQLNNDIKITGNRKNIYYNLPIYTIEISLLKRILKRNKITNQKNIINNVIKEKERIKEILKNNKITDEITNIKKTDWQNNTYPLSLSFIFNNQKITYNYEEYKEHLKQIEQFKTNNKNYNYRINNNKIFKNINILIVHKKQVTISKENDPSIHFIIHHPKLIEAIENFEIPN